MKPAGNLSASTVSCSSNALDVVFLLRVLTLVLTFLILGLRGGVIPDLVWLSVVAFWLTILPGSLLYGIASGKNILQLRSLAVGSAIGLNILPIASYLQALLPSTLSWQLTFAIISVFNVTALVALAKKGRLDWPERRHEHSWRFTATASALWICYLIYHTGYFSISHGLYRFDDFFGGDISYLAGFVEVLQRSAFTSDPHFGGMPVAYHDFLFRWLAGLRFYTGADIYDTIWFFGTTFTALLLALLAYFCASYFSERKAYALLFVLLLLFYPGKSSVIYAENSDTYRMALLQIFALIVLYFELIAGQRSRLGYFLIAAMLAVLAKWKLPAAASMLPALLLTELIEGRRLRAHRGRLVSIAIGCVLGAAVALSLVGTDSGGIVLGRPLGLLLENFQKLLGSKLLASPVISLDHVVSRSIIAFLVLFPVYLVSVAIRSVQSFALVAGRPLGIDRHHKLLRLFLILFLLISAVVPVLISPRYFYTSEVYYRFYGVAVSGLALVVLLPRMLGLVRTGTLRDRAIVFVSAIIAVLQLSFSIYNHYVLAVYPRQYVEASLLSSLRTAGSRTPIDSRIASRRFDLRRREEGRQSPVMPNVRHHIWNFEFYAPSLERTVLLEGPSNGYFGGMATNSDADVIQISRNPVAVRWLERTLTDLDTLYSGSSLILIHAAQQRLGATHLLIDHTIDQHTSPTLAAITDTTFSDSNITLLHFK